MYVFILFILFSISTWSYVLYLLKHGSTIIFIFLAKEIFSLSITMYLIYQVIVYLTLFEILKKPSHFFESKTKNVKMEFFFY